MFMHLGPGLDLHVTNTMYYKFSKLLCSFVSLFDTPVEASRDQSLMR